MTISRKQFLRGGALAAGAVALAKKAVAEEKPTTAAAAPPAMPPPSAIHFPVLKPGEFDHKKMMSVLQAKKAHKVVFQAVEPAVIVPGMSSLAAHIQNLLNGGEFSLGWGKGSVATVAVLYGESAVFALNDAMWSKYGFGKMIKMPDLTRNVFYPAETSMSFAGDPGAGGNVYQDWSFEACQKRGTTFMVCHNALAGIAAMTAMASGGDPAATLADWKANLLPGMLIVPSGVIAVQAAQENGWKLLPLI